MILGEGDNLRSSYMTGHRSVDGENRNVLSPSLRNYPDRAQV